MTLGICRTLVVSWLFLLSCSALGTDATALPLEISPEGVYELLKTRNAVVLIEADDVGRVSSGAGEGVRHVYYTRGPSFRRASELVFRDRQHVRSVEGRGVSQRLLGTPLDWHRLSLPFSISPVPTHPSFVTPTQLSEAIKDGVDLQLVDLRSQLPDRQAIPFPRSMHLMPHELFEKPSLLSKERWVVLIDNGDRTSQPIAEHLFQQGYLLVTALEGGYPAWVKFTDR